MQSDDIDLLPRTLEGHITRSMEHLSDRELTLHRWVPLEPRGSVVYFHGLQSHAGWSWELAADLATEGLSFVCLDRRGSGLSGGPTPDFPAADRATADYARVFELVLEQSPDLPVIAVGHCLGGSVLAATLTQYPSLLRRVSIVAMVSAWLGRMHDSLDDQELARIRSSEEEERCRPVDLSTGDFTSIQRYADFIDHDPLAVRELSERSRKHMLDLEDAYLGNGPGQVRSQFICAAEDRIVDVDRSLAAHRALFTGATSVHILDTDAHYLPFSSQRATLVNLLSAAS